MSELICTRCNTQSPEHAFYCQQCGQPLLCKNCQTPLLSTARACIHCGQLIPERSDNEQVPMGTVSTLPGYSRFKMHETPDVRDLELIVANEAIEHIREVFPLLVGNRPSGKSKSSLDHQIRQQTDLVEITTEVVPSQPQLPAASLQTATSQEGIWNIFRVHEGGTLTQERGDLKATNKKDYIVRLAHLYLYARYQRGDERVPRDDVFKILDEAGVKDTHCSTYIQEAGFRSDENETLRLTLDGRDRAQQYLTETLDTNSPEGWRQGVESRSANNHTKKPLKRDNDDPVIATWVSHEATAELIKAAPHSFIDTMSEQNRALFALYGIHKVGATGEVQVSQISQYLYKAFKIQIAGTNLPRALGKSVDNKPAYAIHRKGHGYQITDSGVERIEQLLQSGK